MNKPLPIGIEFFEEFKRNDYYYVDKTLFIKELIDKKGKVNLFTRPRRFGKTLTLDMLRCFFEEGSDPALFSGLKIMNAGEKYTSMNGKYPVIFLTLKSAKTGNEKSAFEAIRNTLAREFDRHSGILKSDALSSEDASYFIKYRDRKLEPEQYTDSLKFLCECIKKATGKNTDLMKCAAGTTDIFSETAMSTIHGASSCTSVTTSARTAIISPCPTGPTPAPIPSCGT